MKGSRCHKGLISHKLDFDNWIPYDYVLVISENGDCNGGNRRLIATVDDEDVANIFPQIQGQQSSSPNPHVGSLRHVNGDTASIA